jgi:tRNA modification GTPase
MSSADTIVAIASGLGYAAVGVVRISGNAVPRIAIEVLGALPPPRVATLANFRGEAGEVLDQGLALYFPAPTSFTGEPVLELQGHGGAIVLQLLVDRLIALGCRAARPGEFSERAFWNGKIDVTQAEAVADLIGAGTAAAARAAVRSLKGEFSQRVEALQALLTELRIQVEAAIDFPDEDIDFVATSRIHERLARVCAACDALQTAARQGALLRDGYTVVIAGKPNAGKSSLLNALVGDDVAIVADEPGTTRDVLREQVHIDGLPLNLVDTAGLRLAGNAIEAEGIRRARREIEIADRVLYVADLSKPDESSVGELQEQLAALPRGIPLTVIFNKTDLVPGAAAMTPQATATAAPVAGAEPVTIYVSARTRAGLDVLRAHLKASAGYVDAETAGVVSARGRHVAALARARAQLDHAAMALGQSFAPELFAEDLRLAQAALGEITGEFGSEDLLGAIFRSFCIGK